MRQHQRLLVPPTAGTILLDGRPIETVGRHEIARRVQPVFQYPYSSLNPRKTLAALIALPLDIHGIGSRAERRQRVERLMDLVGLPQRLLFVYPSQLSDGQRQRVAIARALAIEPEILVCDEPTSALDVSVQEQILNLLQSLKRSLGLTLVLVSHNLAVVEHMADHLAVVYLGSVIEAGPTREMFARARHPYTQALLEAVLTPEPGRGLPELALGPGFPDPLAPPSGCAFHPRCPQAMAVCATARPAPSLSGGTLVECHLHTPEARRAHTQLATSVLIGSTRLGRSARRLNARTPAIQDLAMPLLSVLRGHRARATAAIDS